MKSAMLLHLHSCQTHNDHLSVYQSQSIRSLLVQIVQIPQDLSLWRNHFIAIRSQVLSNKCNSSDFSIKEYANLKCNFYIMKIIFIDFYFSHGEQNCTMTLCIYIEFIFEIIIKVLFAFWIYLNIILQLKYRN